MAIPPEVYTPEETARRDLKKVQDQAGCDLLENPQFGYARAEYGHGAVFRGEWCQQARHGKGVSCRIPHNHHVVAGFGALSFPDGTQWKGYFQDTDFERHAGDAATTFEGLEVAADGTERYLKQVAASRYPSTDSRKDVSEDHEASSAQGWEIQRAKRFFAAAADTVTEQVIALHSETPEAQAERHAHELSQACLWEAGPFVAWNEPVIRSVLAGCTDAGSPLSLLTSTHLRELAIGPAVDHTITRHALATLYTLDTAIAIAELDCVAAEIKLGALEVRCESRRSQMAQQQQLVNEIEKPYSTMWYTDRYDKQVQPNATLRRREGARLDNYFGHFTTEHYHGPMKLAAEGGDQELALVIHHVRNRRAELQRLRGPEIQQWVVAQEERLQLELQVVAQEEEQMETLLNGFSAEQLEAARLVCSPTEEEMREQKAQTRDVTKQLESIPAELESLEAQGRLLLDELEPLQQQVQDLDRKLFGDVEQHLKEQIESEQIRQLWSNQIIPPAVKLHDAQCELQLQLARVLKLQQKNDQTAQSIAEMHQILSIAPSYEASSAELEITQLALKSLRQEQSDQDTEEVAIGRRIESVRHAIREVQAGRSGPHSPPRGFALQGEAASAVSKLQHHRTEFTSLEGWERHLAETHREIEKTEAEMQKVASEIHAGAQRLAILRVEHTETEAEYYSTVRAAESSLSTFAVIREPSINVVAGEAAIKHSEAAGDLTKLGYMKLKRHLMSLGMPKSQVDTASGKPSLLHQYQIWSEQR